MQGLRYNPGGLLAQAAAGVGGQARLGNQKAADLNFISGEMDRRNRIAELAQENDIEGQKLQMAGQIAAQRGQTSTTPQDGGGFSPFNQAILNAKRLAIQSAGADLDPTEQAAFTADSMNPGQDAFQFNQRIQKTLQDKKNIKAKNDVMVAAKDQIDPADHAQISAMLGDSQYGPQQVMQAIQQSTAKKQKNAAVQQDSQQKQQVWSQAQQQLDPQGIQMLAPLVGDPNTNAHMLAGMLQREFQRVQQAKTTADQRSNLTIGQQSTLLRSQQSVAQQHQQLIEKQYGPLGKADPKTLDPESLQAKVEWDKWEKQSQDAQAKLQQIIGQKIYHPESGKSATVVGLDHDGHPLVEEDQQ